MISVVTFLVKFIVYVKNSLEKGIASIKFSR